MTARRGEAWCWLPLLAAALVAVAWRGGYGADARALVAAIAGLAALTALVLAPEPAGRAARSPVVLALAALALVTALSAAWTTGAPADAARDAAAVLALAALVVAAAAVPGPSGHAAVLLAAALALALLGIGATLARSEPLALNICGTWRPSGTFEYPPALALICAGALPVALCLATGVRRPAAGAGALAAWLLATTAALTANRAGVALCALAITAAVALAPRGRGAGPVALTVVLTAAASTLLLTGDLASAGHAERILALIPGLAAAAVAVRAAGDGEAPGMRRRWTLLVAVAATLATAGIVLADSGGPCGGDPSHGRVGIWRAAAGAAADRPLQGYGAGTFLAATRARQLDERPVPTRFAHDLGLQEWVELGIGGLLAVIAWYLAVAQLAVRAAWPRAVGAPRRSHDEQWATWLLLVAVVAFPIANLLDWPWALTGAGALWAIATGGLIGAQGRFRAGRASSRP